MADCELTPEGDRESKLYIASNNRPRLGSDSSYVTLRETAKIKQGIRKKNERQTPAKGKEKRREDGKRSVKGNSSHFPNTQCCSGLCIHRLLQFLVLFLSVCSLTIIILMILGILGPDHCPCKHTGTSPNSQKTVQKAENSSTKTGNAFAINLSPFYDILEELQANISSLREEAESILQDSGRNKDALMAAKREFNSTRDAVNQFSDGFYAIVDRVNNSVQQFNPDHGPVFTRLQALNETLTNELAEIKRTSEQYNDELDKAIDAMNSTISEQVNVKISLPGPLGERGINGSKGPKGDPGLIGPTGLKGAKGPRGERGSKGSPGNDGYPGANGSKGPGGKKGQPGTRGDDGNTGPQGPQGAPGPSGIGNFSWCEPKVVKVSKPQNATVKDTVDMKVISATCTTEQSTNQDAEANLDVVKSGLNEYKCSCKGHDVNAKCVLYYLACPIQAP